MIFLYFVLRIKNKNKKNKKNLVCLLACVPARLTPFAGRSRVSSIDEDETVA